MRAQLIPPDGARPIEVNRDLTLVGRKEDCDLCLNHKSISKLHCVIVKTDGLLLIRDLGSTNGTRVNGQRVRRAALLPNDQLSIAGLKFRVNLGPGDAPAAKEEFTQQMDAKELANIIRNGERGTPISSSGQMPALPASAAAMNQPLPDVYDDEISFEK